MNIPRSTEPLGRRGSRRLLDTFTARAILATGLVALVSVLVTGIVALPLSLRYENQVARRQLAKSADLAASLLAVSPQQAAEVQLAQNLRQQGITLYLVGDGRPDAPGLPPRVVRRIANGNSVHGVANVAGVREIVEGRVVASSSRQGVVLTMPARAQPFLVMLKRLQLPLLAGLLAGALAGALLARQMARPIRKAAAAAHQLSAGDRSVRMVPELPIEAEELANAFNALAVSLERSEGRQRKFLLSISHELRTPLATLKGYAEALSDGVIQPSEVDRTGSTMLAEATRLELMVHDLLALARLEADDFSISFSLVDLVLLVRVAADAWGPRCAEAGVALQTELPTIPVMLYTDPDRIRQVVDGLMDNALHVIPPGVPLVLAVRVNEAASTRRSGTPTEPSEMAHQSSYAILEIRDGGPGLQDGDLSVAFEEGVLHERYRESRKVGSGLGLALAAGLVRRLGGSIEASHAAEGGACFAIRLPMNRKDHQ